jgi:hypothetical protein
VAGDWIKMRVWLRRDPRVASIADFLALHRPFMDSISDPVRCHCSETAYEHVTSDVTRAITVVSLLEVWGVARERGDRDEDDLLLKHCDLSNLDDICGTPGFGEAMDYVSWATQETAVDSKGRKYQQVRFPKFFSDNESPDDRYRKQHAEAQARYRQKVTSPVTSPVMSPADITVTPREEKRREVKTHSSSVPDEGFLTFWKTYPRRVAKKDAIKAWLAINPDELLRQRMLRAIAAQKLSPQWRDPKMIPYPASWLNGQRWDDEVTPPQQTLSRVGIV